MSFRILVSPGAQRALADLKHMNPMRHRKVGKCLYLIGQDPKYPGLHSKRYESLDGRYKEPIWQSYAENNVPTAYRVFWHYGPSDGEITVVAITPHP